MCGVARVGWLWCCSAVNCSEVRLLQGFTESLEALRAEEHVERVAVCVVEREEVRQLVHPNVGRVEVSCGCGACFELHCSSE